MPALSSTTKHASCSTSKAGDGAEVTRLYSFCGSNERLSSTKEAMKETSGTRKSGATISSNNDQVSSAQTSRGGTAPDQTAQANILQALKFVQQKQKVFSKLNKFRISMLKEKAGESAAQGQKAAPPRSPPQATRKAADPGSASKNKAAPASPTKKQSTGMNSDLTQLADVYPLKSRDAAAARRKSRTSRSRAGKKYSGDVTLAGGTALRGSEVLSSMEHVAPGTMEPKLASAGIGAVQISPRRRASQARSRLAERMDTAERTHRLNQQLPQHIRGAPI